jgi:hypothetical protein
MKHKNHIERRAIRWAMLSIVCLASTPANAEPAWWTQQKRDCGLPSSLAYNNWDGRCNSAGSSSAPSSNAEAARRAQEAAADAQRQQYEAEQIERERLAKEKRQKDAAFIRDRDAAAGTLKGSSGGAMDQLQGIAGADSSGLKGSGFDAGNQLKSAPASTVNDRAEPASPGGKSKSASKSATSKPAPYGDSNVVDARNVPSGLPKSLDNAIAKAYANAPPGVSDRVRKGFQAVMVRDWKLAKAWFQDALNRDPTNAGLKRLVALTDTSQQPAQQPATAIGRNEPAGLGGRSNANSASAPPGKTTPATAVGGELQRSDPNDIYFLFPGLKAIEDKAALDYLFGLDPYPPTPKPGKTK